MKRCLAFIVSLCIVCALFCSVPDVAEDYVHWGIDVSYWQGSINWNSVKSAGVEFAILRAWCWQKDTRFEEYYANAKAAGVPVGAYSYIYAETIADARTEANNLLSVLKGKQFEYPIYIDVEESKYQSMNKALVTSIVKTELDILEAAGYYAAFYTGTYFAYNALNLSDLAAYDCWIADYRGYCGYTGAHGMWQYSSTGSISGISGNVDLNYCYRDYPTIIKTAGLNGYPPTQVVTYPYTINDASLMLYDGETTAPISTAFNTNVSLVTENTQGQKSLKANCNIPAGQNSKVGGMVFHTLTNATDLTPYDVVEADVYFSRTLSGSNGLQFNFCTSGEDGYNALLAVNNWSAGWHTVRIELKKVGKAVDSANWANIKRMRITWYNYAQTDAATYFLLDNLRAIKIADEPEPPAITYPYAVDSQTAMIYDAETIDSLVTAFNTDIRLYAGAKTQGRASLKMVSKKPIGQNGNVGAMALQTFSNTADLSNYAAIAFDLYLSRNMTGSNGFQINFAAQGQDGYNYMRPLNNWDAGWHHVVIPLTEFTKAVTTANWKSVKVVRYTWFNFAQSDEETYFLIDNVQALTTIDPDIPPTPLPDPAVTAVIDAIAALPEPKNIKESDAQAVLAAESAYKALNDEQKEQVTNAQKLQDVLAAIGNINTLKYGDVNDDLRIDANDALITLKAAVAKTVLTVRQRQIADVNADKSVDAVDALMILQFSVKKIYRFPAEKI